MAVKKAAPATKATATKKAVASSRAKAANGASTTGAGGGKKAAAKKTPAAAKTAAKTAASGSTTTTTPTRAAAKKATAARTPASTAKRTTASRAKKASAPASALAVRAEEDPWTSAELAAVRAELEEDVSRLRAEISAAEIDLVGLMRDAGDGSGDDQADAGAKTYEREQEISVANNTREMLDQSEHALERIADGSYGICESCGNPIGKLRLQAFPRATLCVTCKQKQERR
ncbi:MAG TPA: TraR/DksA C4-type zinc finger protein [Oryzihumus sp.]|nr:TraR/DksA C4-type zinc finger protein [Oryzihumus sp.]